MSLKSIKISKSTTFYNISRVYDMHKKKLDTIKPLATTVAEAKNVKEESKRAKQQKEKNKQFNQNETNLKMNKDNQILLNKLVEISSGKWSSIK